jgi:hypothetical protein
VCDDKRRPALLRRVKRPLYNPLRQKHSVRIKTLPSQDRHVIHPSL